MHNDLMSILKLLDFSANLYNIDHEVVLPAAFYAGVDRADFDLFYSFLVGRTQKVVLVNCPLSLSASSYNVL